MQDRSFFTLSCFRWVTFFALWLSKNAWFTFWSLNSIWSFHNYYITLIYLGTESDTNLNEPSLFTGTGLILHLFVTLIHAK